MVRDHRGREWSVATKDCPNFLRQVLSTLGQSKNPEIHYFQKLPNKNFKVLLKRFLLGSYDLPGFLDYWIIITTKSSRPHHIDQSSGSKELMKFQII